MVERQLPKLHTTVRSRSPAPVALFWQRVSVESASIRARARHVEHRKSDTHRETVRMMEAIWDDLARDPAALTPPEWHARALKDAERAHAENQVVFVPWDIAKKKLRDGTS